MSSGMDTRSRTQFDTLMGYKDEKRRSGRRILIFNFCSSLLVSTFVFIVLFVYPMFGFIRFGSHFFSISVLNRIVF